MKRPENYLNIQQQSPEWLHERCGSVTASRIADIGKLKSGKPSEKRRKYMLELLTETITGNVTEHYVSVPMQFGIENEGLARTTYEMERGVEVEKIGYVRHASIPRCGASPDGLIGEHGLVEIKCPNTTTHLEYILSGEVPDDYKPQMMWQMACSGRAWCDFVSFDPRLPSDFWLFVMRYYRDDKAIASMEADVTAFIAELNEMCERLQKRGSLVPTLEKSLEAAKAAKPPRAEIPSFQ